MDNGDVVTQKKNSPIQVQYLGKIVDMKQLKNNYSKTYAFFSGRLFTFAIDMICMA